MAVIFDLRRATEVLDAPGPRPCLHVELPSRRIEDTNPATLLERADGERWLFEDYCGMLDKGSVVFAEIFTRLAVSGQGSAVFRCWGGKDRTGMTAVLLLGVLGVDRDTALDDYELTSQWRGVEHVPAVVDLFAATGMARSAAEGMLSTPRWAMGGALDHLEVAHGGVERYLCERVGMTAGALEALRKALVR